MAVDPLSGNGIFQSLSVVVAGPGGDSTPFIGKKPDGRRWPDTVHQQRAGSNCLLRFARIGRDFYAMEQQWGRAASFAAEPAQLARRPAA
ncbi:hypothetical protein D3879_25560 [Pseudomonas cavernicola]|uniref:Uncharacterized protein n=1 Tax=Pseudomonas cavernicola TaxID=2320866 RepID=A0A418X9K2_9PSED|nr:hypothetical protein [Pseudomonas cavernicola]RJG09166.1 hypothetical protein D3879_25560 [Pseudomonas cavernicola]